jgi:biopolymer transport protein ExbB/TolQ
MKRSNSSDFVFQAGALIVSLIVVHAAYVLVVRPRAEAVLTEQAIAMQNDSTFVPSRSSWVIVRDFEQEACFVLMLWAMAILAQKGWNTARERRLLDLEFVPREGDAKIRPVDSPLFVRKLETLPVQQQQGLLPRSLLTALRRFAVTANIQDVSNTAKEACDAEAERLESELSMMRYIAWAIPSIGFIGTVRGIGEALAQAHKAVEGDITGVTQSLGVAFNSTFIALLISIVLMFLVHQLQLHQERLVLDTEDYLDRHLIEQLRVE